MRFWSIFLLLALTPFAIASSLMAQSVGSSSAPQETLPDAKEKALLAERRSELLRQEASNTEGAADRLVAQRAVLSAEIDAAEAQIEAANARISIISRRQQLQRAQLGVESEPVLRLNAALQQMTGRPAVLMMMQPGQREDYVHLRAVMATVQPEIIRRTSALRQQIAVQSELRAQELRALKSLGDARSRLRSAQTDLATLQGDAGGNAGELSANAAIAFEQAIAQGERSRDIVGRMDIQRLSAEKASELAALDGPMLRPGRATKAAAAGTAYILPARGKLLSGFHELNATGYRERGVRFALANDLRVVAPAAGTVSFAGRYRSYGRIVIIEHGSGWNSLITNLGSTQVKKGQAVAQGAVLGSAKSDAPEIGIELRKNGRVMDIATILG
jgi:septal ring factor EnvC (AmiA/AmiB activator)